MTRIFGVLAILVAVRDVTAPANAFTLTSFTDRESWESSVQGSFSEETFNSYAEDLSFNGIDQNMGNFTLNGTGSRQKIDVPSFDVPLFSVDGTPMILGQTDSSSSFTITFDVPIISFGAYFSDITSQGITQITAESTLVVNTPQTVEIPQNTQFFGFIADEAFNTLIFDSANDDLDGFGMDNLVYVQMNSSPNRNLSIQSDTVYSFEPVEFSPALRIPLTSNNIRNTPFNFSPTLGLLSVGGICLVVRWLKSFKS
ncbi:MAG: hypothetical protein AB4372_11240 [Xenococcus sp. (in: cyanobacteria)]